MSAGARSALRTVVLISLGVAIGVLIYKLISREPGDRSSVADPVPRVIGERPETTATKLEPAEPEAGPPVGADPTREAPLLAAAEKADEPAPEPAPEPQPSDSRAGLAPSPPPETRLALEPPAAGVPSTSGTITEPPPADVVPEPEPPSAAPEPIASVPPSVTPAPDDVDGSLAVAARRWLATGTRYDAAYQPIPYPGGDVPADRGAAVDLVVRAFRELGVDLQLEIHEEILADPAAYGVSAPDTNIDHRRIRNVVTFLRRNATSLSTARDGDWRAGDLVVWDVNGDGRSDHLGILTERAGVDDLPLVIHHFRENELFSGSPSEDDVLFNWPVEAHYRWPGPARGSGRPAGGAAPED